MLDSDLLRQKSTEKDFSVREGTFPVFAFQQGELRYYNSVAKKKYRVRKGMKLQSVFGTALSKKIGETTVFERVVAYDWRQEEKTSLLCVVTHKGIIFAVELPFQYSELAKNVDERELLCRFIEKMPLDSSCNFAELISVLDEKICEVLADDENNGFLKNGQIELSDFTNKAFDAFEKTAKSYGCKLDAVHLPRTSFVFCDGKSYGILLLSMLETVIRYSSSGKLMLSGKETESAFIIRFTGRASKTAEPDGFCFTNYLAWRLAEKFGFSAIFTCKRGLLSFELTMPKTAKGVSKLGAVSEELTAEIIGYLFVL